MFVHLIYFTIYLNLFDNTLVENFPVVVKTSVFSYFNFNLSIIIIYKKLINTKSDITFILYFLKPFLRTIVFNIKITITE